MPRVKKRGRLRLCALLPVGIASLGGVPVASQEAAGPVPLPEVLVAVSQTYCPVEDSSTAREKLTVVSLQYDIGAVESAVLSGTARSEGRRVTPPGRWKRK